MIEPLKILDRLWDKIAKARLPERLKATLLIMVTLALLIYSFWVLLLIQQITDLVKVLVGHP